MEITRILLLLCASIIFTSSHAGVYEDAEDGNTNGWFVYTGDSTGAIISNVYDSDASSRVIDFQGTSHGYMLGNLAGREGAWKNSNETNLSWRIKYSDWYTFYVSVSTENGHRYLQYTADGSDKGNRGNGYIHHGLGGSTRSGAWVDISRDLEADILEYESGNHLLSVNGFMVRGNGRVDDIVLSGGSATPISPTGLLDTDTPTYRWNASSNASWYYLWVDDSSGNVVNQWYRSSDVGCGTGSGVCTVTPGVALAKGAGQWWIQPWSDSAGYGAWSNSLLFDVKSNALPSAATLVSPGGKVSDATPRYTWNAVANASWYYLWVDDSSGNVIKKWYRSSDVGCDSERGTCSVIPEVTLSKGSGRWWVQTWNSSGYGPWSSAMLFDIDRGDNIYGEYGTYHVKTYSSYGYVVYYPEGGLEEAPLAFFLPGGGDKTSINDYSGLMNFMASHGVFVIGTNAKSYSPSPAIDSLSGALASAKKYHPELNFSKLGILGHSLGGGIAFPVMKHFLGQGYGAEANFVVSLDGWFSFGMNQGDLGSLNTTASFMQFNGYVGTGTDPRIDLTILNLLPDNTEKSFITLGSNNHSYAKGNLANILEKTDLLAPIHALMDYKFNGNRGGYNILFDGYQSTVNSINQALKSKDDPRYSEGDCEGVIYNAKPVIDKFDIDYCHPELYH
jgi:thioesterase domain-containing protein